MSYYLATDLIKATALANGIMTSVTHGALQDIDIKRQTLFPLLHVVPQAFTINQKTASYSFSLLFLDLVDFNKSDLRDEANPYWGTDNLIDVFNQMSLAAQLFAMSIQQLQANVNISIPTNGSFVSNRFENLLSGVEIQLTLTYPNTFITDGTC
jgi:hypothetical protein